MADLSAAPMRGMNAHHAVADAEVGRRAHWPYEGLSMHEAAEITGIGQAAFRSRLHQARLRVRAAISGQALVTAGG